MPKTATWPRRLFSKIPWPNYWVIRWRERNQKCRGRMEASVRCSAERPPIASWWGHRQDANRNALQTLPAREPDDFDDTAGKISGFSLQAVMSVSVKATGIPRLAID
jgi:hypothetical protein